MRCGRNENPKMDHIIERERSLYAQREKRDIEPRSVIFCTVVLVGIADIAVWFYFGSSCLRRRRWRRRKLWVARSFFCKLRIRQVWTCGEGAAVNVLRFIWLLCRCARFRSNRVLMAVVGAGGRTFEGDCFFVVMSLAMVVGVSDATLRSTQGWWIRGRGCRRVFVV